MTHIIQLTLTAEEFLLLSGISQLGIKSAIPVDASQAEDTMIRLMALQAIAKKMVEKSMQSGAFESLWEKMHMAGVAETMQRLGVTKEEAEAYIDEDHL